MKQPFRKILIPVLLVSCISLVSSGEGAISRIGQYVVTSLDTSVASSVFLEPDEVGKAELGQKLDDLVSSWYINNIFLPAEGMEDFSYHRQLVIPDSVLINRLKRVEAAVGLSFNSVVRDYIRMYLEQRPRQVEIMIGLTSFFYPLFEEVLDRYELPLELKNLAIIESALNPRAISRAGAVGLWQIMYGTGKGLNLEISTYVDERRDVLKATDAAARYLKQLYSVYRDWHLVIAAYNCGPGNVNKAIARSGGKTNYWEIYYALPRETRGYVPAYIAATYMMNYYRVHGLNPQLPSIALNTDTIMVGRYLNLEQVADNLELDLEALRDLNPMYRYDILPGSPEKQYPLRIPAEHVSAFLVKEEAIYNHERNIHFPDNTLVKPKTSVPDPVPGNDGKTRITYTVKSGDNPGYISRWFDVPLSDLKRWNHLSRNIIRTGQKLTVYVPSDKTDYYKKINTLSFSAKQALVGHKAAVNKAPSAEPQTEVLADGRGQATSQAGEQEFEYYTVKKGDNLWTIARHYPGISNSDIMRLNNITDARRLRAGQKLKIKPKS